MYNMSHTCKSPSDIIGAGHVDALPAAAAANRRACSAAMLATSTAVNRGCRAFFTAFALACSADSS
jgi:hypothetical protein